MDSTCIFCKIVNGEIPSHKIGENKDFICFLDIKPITRGHALIVPKRHFRDVLEFPAELDREYFSFAQQMARKIVAAVGADGFNLSMNNGAAAGQVVFHQHTHLIPRFQDDGLKSWPHQEMTTEELALLKQRIIGS